MLKITFCLNLPRSTLSMTRDRSVLYKHKNRAPIMGVGNDMGWVCLIGPNGVRRVRLIIMSLQNVIPRPRNWLCLHQMSSRDPKAELWLFQQRPFNDGVTCPFVMVVGSVKRSLPDIWIQEITWFRERWPVAVLEIHFERFWSNNSPLLCNGSSYDGCFGEWSLMYVPSQHRSHYHHCHHHHRHHQHRHHHNHHYHRHVT